MLTAPGSPPALSQAFGLPQSTCEGPHYTVPLITIEVYLIGVDIASCPDSHNMSVVSEHRVQHWTVVLPWKASTHRASGPQEF